MNLSNRKDTIDGNCFERVKNTKKKKKGIFICYENWINKNNITDVDFKLHVDPAFGNCYTFNWDVNNNHSSSKAGPMYG